MKKWIVRLCAAAILAMGGVWVLLAVRYPGMNTEQAVRYVAVRSAWIIREHTDWRDIYAARESAEIELANVRAIALEMAPELAGAPPLEKAQILNRLVHEKVPVRGDPTFQDFSDLDQTVWRALRDPRFGHQCQGLSFVYLALLKAFGVKARAVGLYQDAVNAPDPVNSHASVDVHIKGRWVALDPTFNMSLRDSSGRMLGWADARQMVMAGQPVTFTNEGASPGRFLTDYYNGSAKPFLGVFNFAAFGPSSLGAVKFLPLDWDGSVHYASGNIFRATFAKAR